MRHMAHRTAYVLLFGGAALVWIWEFAVAAFGGHNPLLWTLVAVGLALILASYSFLARDKRS